MACETPSSKAGDWSQLDVCGGASSTRKAAGVSSISAGERGVVGRRHATWQKSDATSFVPLLFKEQNSLSVQFCRNTL